MKHQFLFPVCALILLATSSSAIMRYVSPTGGNSSPYTNWAMAATDIQSAINACTNGDVVIVTNGTYNTGGVAVYGNMTNRIAITNAITVKSVNGAAFTRIVGQGPIGSNAIRCAWVASNAVLDGFTLSDGFTLAEGHSVNETCGGGVWCEYDGAIISNCVITTCGAANMGGGFHYGRVVNCVISNSTAVYGGGGEGSSADADVIDRCTFVANRSVRDGGGLYGGKSVRNSHFAGNKAGELGGGMRAVWNAESCTVAGNFAQEGGGVSGTTISNSVIYYNTDQFGSPNHGGSVISYSCTTPHPGGAGNITNSPGLAGLWNPHLVTNSPCLNKGTNSEWMVAAVDIDGDARLGGQVDIGCDEMVITNLSISSTIQSDCTNVVVGVPIRFNIEIRNRPRHFSWSFGDGSNAGAETVVEHAFAQAGNYVITNRTWGGAGYIEATRGIHAWDSFTNYVAKGGSDTAPYDTWAKAASNIQAAVSICAKGGTVLISNGVYNLGGAELFSSNRVAITNAMTVRGVNGAAQTVILGVPLTSLEAMRGAYVCSGGRLEGVTLCDGRSRGSSVPIQNISETLGGGLFAESGAVIVDCVISNNGALNGGGSVGWGTFEGCTLADNSAANSGGGALYGYFRNCTIAGNEADYGAGLSQAEADGCQITNNRASEWGGGMQYGSARRCLLEDNYATTYSSSVGGAAYYSSLDNCLVVWNYARAGGGGTFSGSVRNCTIRGNDVSSGAGGGTYGSSVDSSIVYLNYAVSDANTHDSSCNYSCTTPDPGGTGNITDDPQFVNDFLGDYRLLPGSPCIDKGDPLSTVSNDYDGVWRPLDGNGDGTNRVDMGAYEFAATSADNDADGLSDSLEVYTYHSDPHRADTDADAQTDGEEVLAGSDPTNSTSYFRAGTLDRDVAGPGYVVSWDSLTGRVYTLREVSPIAGAWSNVAGYASYTGTGARISYINPAPSDVRFHSLRVRRAP